VSTSEKDEVMATMTRVVRDEKITALMVEHDVDLAFNWGTSVMVLSQGKIVAMGKPVELRKNPEVVELGYGE